MKDKTFDLAAFEAADTADLQVLNPKNEPVLVEGKPVTITLYGPGSTFYAKAQARLNDALSTRSFAALRGKPLKETAEEQQLLIAEKLAACTKVISNFPIDGGALALYTNPKLGYITNQVSQFIEDWANFTGGSATT